MKCRGAAAGHPVELMEQTTATTVNRRHSYTSSRRRVEREGVKKGADDYKRSEVPLQS